MSGWLPTLLGWVAGCCSAAALVPQVLKIWREGVTEAISLRMYVMRVTGFALWVGYGLLIGSTPVVVFSILNFVLGGTVLTLKLRAEHPSGPSGDP